jgi:hypothetical protein
MSVFTCPVCASVRIVSVVGLTRRAFCTACGARWLQEGPVQRAIQRPRGTLLHLVDGTSRTPEGDASA